ncbi:hypothetical protein BROUX41_005921 [Berkeleyomyces rouxiae]|uniref:uncharacterized protein n=1 Tax=Berkeleyomyces rouxiae TaxID=2035830 RepID=UPI003B7F1EA9
MHSSILLFVAALAHTSASALPRRHATITNKPSLNPEPWPTTAPNPEVHAGLLHKRFNVVCGYINGDPLMPATCNPGSHCAVDKALGAVGCCPDEGPCDTGIFIGCVDMTGPPPAEVNPLVYTCGAGQVCYRNNYEGGYSQFGCGTPGSQPATVLMNVAGRPKPDIQEVNIKANPTQDGEVGAGAPTPAPGPTGEASSSSTTKTSQPPSSTPSRTTSSSSSKTSDPATTSSPVTPPSSASRAEKSYPSSTTTTTTTNSTSSSSSIEEAYGMVSTASAESSETPTPSKENHADVGAVVGSTLSGVAAFLALGAVGFYYYRKNQRNQPSPPPNEKSMSPNSSHGSFSSHSPTSMTEPMFLVTADFPLPPVGAAVSTNHKMKPEKHEIGRAHSIGQAHAMEYNYNTGNVNPTVTTTATATAATTTNTKSAKDNTMSYASSTYSRYLQPGALPSPTSPYSDNGLDLAREVDDFQNSYIAALGDIREETESNYSRTSMPPPVPPMPQKPNSAWL